MSDEDTKAEEKAEETTPAAEEAAPAAEPAKKEAPAKEEKAPAKEEKAPAKEEKAPAKEEKAPAKEEKAPKPAAEETPEPSVELSKKAQKILDGVKELSVLELADLVKAMEDVFGVSAAAPVAMMAGGGGGGGGDAGGGEEKSSFDVELISAGGSKINVIKAVREITGLGLKEAKDIVDGAPQNVKEGLKKEEAEEIKTKLEEAGASVELK